MMPSVVLKREDDLRSDYCSLTHLLHMMPVAVLFVFAITILKIFADFFLHFDIFFWNLTHLSEAESCLLHVPEMYNILCDIDSFFTKGVN